MMIEEVVTQRPFSVGRDARAAVPRAVGLGMRDVVFMKCFQ